MSEINLALRQRLTHLLRIEIADGPPKLVPPRVEEDESWREFESVDGRKLTPNRFLNIEADHEEPVFQFFFELVNDGLQCSAGNSVR